jgi:hypothetical protein
MKAFGKREHGLDWKWNWISSVSIKKMLLLLSSSDDYGLDWKWNWISVSIKIKNVASSEF